jgi:hypothetical protein
MLPALFVRAAPAVVLLPCAAAPSLAALAEAAAGPPLDGAGLLMAETVSRDDSPLSLPEAASGHIMYASFLWR